MALPKMMQDVWDNHLDSLTPMMKMYLETKKQHDDCIIFYRLGDFYEMFFDDATTASKVNGNYINRKKLWFGRKSTNVWCSVSCS